MADLSDEHVTIVAVPAGGERDRLLDKGQERHDEPHDLVAVMVPPGRWREVRDAVWEALNTAPGKQRDQSLWMDTGYEDNLSRVAAEMADSQDPSDG